jgi:hypothetical protein
LTVFVSADFGVKPTQALVVVVVVVRVAPL